jgi:hypothetical protein
MVSGIVAVLTVAAAAQDFFEGWESTQTGDYSPATTPYLSGDAGSWFLADTITQSTDCDGTSRNQALRNLALRTGVEEVDLLVAMLVQADRFGTSMAESLRTHAGALSGRISAPALSNRNSARSGMCSSSTASTTAPWSDAASISRMRAAPASSPLASRRDA